METKRLRLLHVRAVRYLKAIDKKNLQIKDIDLMLSIQREKPALESFLNVSEQWYLNELVKAVDVITFCENRHYRIISEINETLIKTLI